MYHSPSISPNHSRSKRDTTDEVLTFHAVSVSTNSTEVPDVPTCASDEFATEGSFEEEGSMTFVQSTNPIFSVPEAVLEIEREDGNPFASILFDQINTDPSCTIATSVSRQLEPLHIISTDPANHEQHSHKANCTPCEVKREYVVVPMCPEPSSDWPRTSHEPASPAQLHERATRSTRRWWLPPLHSSFSSTHSEKSFSGPSCSSETMTHKVSSMFSSFLSKSPLNGTDARCTQQGNHSVSLAGGIAKMNKVPQSTLVGDPFEDIFTSVLSSNSIVAEPQSSLKDRAGRLLHRLLEWIDTERAFLDRNFLKGFVLALVANVFAIMCFTTRRFLVGYLLGLTTAFAALSIVVYVVTSTLGVATPFALIVASGMLLGSIVLCGLCICQWRVVRKQLQLHGTLHGSTGGRNDTSERPALPCDRNKSSVAIQNSSLTRDSRRQRASGAASFFPSNLTNPLESESGSHCGKSSLPHKCSTTILSPKGSRLIESRMQRLQSAKIQRAHAAHIAAQETICNRSLHALPDLTLVNSDSFMVSSHTSRLTSLNSGQGSCHVTQKTSNSTMDPHLNTDFLTATFNFEMPRIEPPAKIEEYFEKKSLQMCKFNNNPELSMSYFTQSYLDPNTLSETMVAHLVHTHDLDSNVSKGQHK